MPNYRRYYLRGHPVFVTVVARQRRNVFATSENKELVLNAMRLVRLKWPFRHLAHCLLPDHLHWLFVPVEHAHFSKIVAATKRQVTWAMKRTGIEAAGLWQPRFYDHVIRNRRDLEVHLDYIHYNPVKHGYAEAPRDYRWSSFAEWVKRGNYAANWGDNCCPTHIASLNWE